MTLNPQEFQLFPFTPSSGNGNYTATGPITFSTGTLSTDPATWQIYLHYQSSAMLPAPATDPTTQQFSSSPNATYGFSGFPVDNTTAGGGQGLATVTATLPDNGIVQDCVFFYVEGPETGDGVSGKDGGRGGLTGGGGIPDDTINPTLITDYQGSNSYNAQNLLNSQGTVELMTGIAMHETGCSQFETPAEGNSDLFTPFDGEHVWRDLLVPAKWPKENTESRSTKPAHDVLARRGEYIGLLQVGSFTDPDAWDWSTNAQDGVNLFSGGSSADKVHVAVNFESYIRSGLSGVPGRINADKTILRNLTATERENNALVFYSGNVTRCGSRSCTANSLYYIPVCPSPGAISMKGSPRKEGDDYVCTGADWYWAVNDPLVDTNVNKQHVCPSGVGCILKNEAALLYVSNNPQDPYFNSTKQPGVRDYVQSGGQSGGCQ